MQQTLTSKMYSRCCCESDPRLHWQGKNTALVLITFVSLILHTKSTGLGLEQYGAWSRPGHYQAVNPGLPETLL